MCHISGHKIMQLSHRSPAVEIENIPIIDFALLPKVVVDRDFFGKDKGY
jgi:hypothetical protein